MPSTRLTPVEDWPAIVTTLSYGRPGSDPTPGFGGQRLFWAAYRVPGPLKPVPPFPRRAASSSPRSTSLYWWSGRLAAAAVATHSSETRQDKPSQWSGHRPSSPAERFRCRAWVVQHGGSPCSGPSIRDAVNHRLESRMRENRLHGSEGGEAGSTGLPYPYMRVPVPDGRGLGRLECPW